MSKSAGLHENFERDEDIQGSSERSFGIVFAVVFLIIGLFPLLREEPVVRLWSLGVAGAFLASAFLCPKILSPLNRLWFKFGLLLYKIVNPITLGLLFFTTVMPIGLFMRLLGKDLLNKKLDDQAQSYWVIRDPAGPKPETMKQQF